MHWSGSNTAAVVFGLVGGLWGPCLSLYGTPAAQVAATPEKRGSGSERDAQPADWGARLSVSPQGRPAAQKGTNLAAGGPAGQSPGPTPLAIPLVQGYDSFGLSLPDHDLEGRLRSLFVIGAISRIDDRNVEIRESFLETYAEDGSPEFSIELPKATLDRFTRVLVAKTPVTLRKAEFELKGASLEFNTVTKEGGLGGPVQMTIYNGVASTSPKKAASPSQSVRTASPAPK
jgi:hypothetical protein